MNDLPLNGVENTRDNLVQTLDGNQNIKRSPCKLTMTEKRVIGGLKNLTELLFKQHYKHSSNAEVIVSQNEDPLQSNEILTSTENESNSTDKENENCQQYLNNAMENGQAEQFCGMIVRQLTTGAPIDHTEEWHRDQLDAYNLAHERLFQQSN